jgi:hypothetical protein
MVQARHVRAGQTDTAEKSQCKGGDVTMRERGERKTADRVAAKAAANAPKPAYTPSSRRLEAAFT